MDENEGQFMWYRGNEQLTLAEATYAHVTRMYAENDRRHTLIKFFYADVPIEHPYPGMPIRGMHRRLCVRTFNPFDMLSEPIEYCTDALAEERYPEEWAQFKGSGNYLKPKKSKFMKPAESAAVSHQTALAAQAWFEKEAADVLPTLEDMFQADKEYAQSFRADFMLALANPQEIPNQHDADYRDEPPTSPHNA